MGLYIPAVYVFQDYMYSVYNLMIFRGFSYFTESYSKDRMCVDSNASERFYVQQRFLWVCTVCCDAELLLKGQCCAA